MGEFYNKDCVYFPYIMKIQHALNREMEETRIKTQFYQSLPRFYTEVVNDISPTIRLKKKIYKSF